MNTILVLTDFTIRAQRAAEFACQIASRAGAEIILCNAIEHAENENEAEHISWPLPDHLTLKEESLNELIDLKQHLEQTVWGDSYRPSIRYISHFGKLSKVASQVIEENDVTLTVMGAHKSSALTRFLLGSHTHKIIDELSCPVLLVPEGFASSAIHNITYATDLTFSNTRCLSYLSEIAKCFDSEILVSHISPRGEEGLQSGKALLHLVNELFPQGQPKVSYINVKGEDVSGCLLALGTQGRESILAVVHKRYNWIDGLFHASISKKIADSALVPLLVLPYSYGTDVTDLTGELLEHISYHVDEPR